MMELGKANLDVFADTLLDMARVNPNILVVTSDSRGSGKLGPFGEALARQHIEVGIAEQDLIGVAAGLCRAFSMPCATSPCRTSSNLTASPPSGCVTKTAMFAC
ncbi:MAG: hypothetical protein GC204_02210, partial [Chloroflexi bacterium]|nr:hypothetical protein [Chloroflexota bacterium]